MEYAIDVAIACHELGLKTVAVTAGYINPKPREKFYHYMDAANVDLKAFTENFYSGITKGHLEPILDTLRYLKNETKVWFEITNLVIPGENDSEAETSQMSSWVVKNLGPDVPMHFTAFHPDYRMMDRPPTPPATLTRARAIALENGVRYAYTGNVHDESGQSTYCHRCHTKLISRDWYVLGTWDLTSDGHCQKCGAPCAGVFQGPPGQWGARRLPVQLKQIA